MTSRLAIIIVNHNTAEPLTSCLASLAAAGLPEATQVVVVDTGSTDDSVARASDFRGVQVIAPGRNLGYGAAANLGASATTSEFLALMNADIVLEPGAFAAGIAFLDRTPAVGAISPVLLTEAGLPYAVPVKQPTVRGELLAAVQVSRLPWLRRLVADTTLLPGHDFDWQSVEILPGALVLARRVAYTAIGGFNPRYRMYFEDVELSVALREAGWRLAIVGGMRAIHLGGRSYEQRAVAMQRHLHRSRRRFFRQRGGWRGDLGVRAASLIEASLRLAALPFPRLQRHQRALQHRRDSLLTALVLFREAFRVR